MKYKDRDDLVKGLRDLADFIEEKGLELPFDSYFPPVRITQRFYPGDSKYGDPKEALVRAAKAFGFAEKRYRYSDLEVVKKFNRLVEMIYETNRENVCTKRVVETKQVPKFRTVEIPGEFDTEEVVEWDCEPLLAPVSEK